MACALGRVDVGTGSIAHIQLPPGYLATEVIDGKDGTLWMTGPGDADGGSILLQYNPATAVFTPHRSPIGDHTYASSYGLAKGADGNLWFTEVDQIAKIGEYSPTSDQFSQYSIPSGRDARSITPGPDGNLWFTELNGLGANHGQIGKVDLHAPDPSADLAIAATVTPGPYQFGSPLTYTLTVTNNGPSAAQTILATAVLPDNVAFAGAQGGTTGLSYDVATGTVTFSLDGLASGASVDVPIQVYSTALGTHDSKILVASPATYQVPIFLVRDAVTDPIPTNNDGPLPAVNVVPATTDLSIVAGAVPASVNVDGTLTYTMTLVNAGPSGAEDVVVTDQLPPGVVYTGPIDPTTALAGYAYQADQRIVTYHSFSLPPSPEDGSSVQISIPVKVLAGDNLSTVGTAWSLSYAIAISNAPAAQIVGPGKLSGANHGFLLTPR